LVEESHTPAVGERFGSTGSGLRYARAREWFGPKPKDGGREAPCVSGFVQESRLPVLDELVRSASAAGDNGKASAEPLDDHLTEGLWTCGRVDEDVVSVQEGNDVTLVRKKRHSER
jgi:hypothetical protein